MDALITSLVQANFAPERIIPRASMARYTTFRVGGNADVLVNIASPAEIPVALRAAKHAGVPVTLIGNGSNLLVRDGGIRGLVIRIAGECSAIRRDNDCIIAQAGASMSSIAQFALNEGLEGLAEIAGIPGTIGGGVIMNAGAYGNELANMVTRVCAVSESDGKPVVFEGADLGFSYRHSALMDAHVIVTEVTMQLTPGDPAAIRTRMNELAQARRDKQPLNFPSAGSTFKRPQGLFAAKLIDDCGLRGLRVGDAQVSEKHAGFVVNLGNATASDVLALMEEIKQRVFAATGVTLEPEVRILGEDAKA
ncbi:MAG: UDP-N-acetylmuramate dehydrogenase [Clostridia bacterium]|nr:UDP-N-acetylmuramate dehydrogenase [Clostridia bacterium]